MLIVFINAFHIFLLFNNILIILFKGGSIILTGLYVAVTKEE